MHLSVIIPAKNEKKHIQRTVKAVFDYLKSKNIEHEIIVVTNKSGDGTPELVKAIMPEVPSLKLLDYPMTGGKGFAVKEGMLHAKGDYCLFMDADNSTTIDHIEKMMPYFEQGYGVVIASIRVPGHKVLSGSEQWYRRFLGRLSNVYTQMIILPGIMDTQRGFKIFTAEAAKKIFPISRITQFGFDIEVLALARKFKYKIKEVGVLWNNDPNTGSHPSLSSYVQVLKDTLKIKWWLVSGKYNQPASSVAAETVK